MKSFLEKLFGPRAESQQQTGIADAARESRGRKYNGKRSNQAPKGAFRINPDQPIIQQVRGKR